MTCSATWLVKPPTSGRREPPQLILGTQEAELKVFIYGTLKQDFPLHDKGLENARYIGEVQTVQPYPLFIAGSFFGPMMLDRPGEGLRVKGELYEIDDGRLPVLDELEAVGEAGSFRSRVDVVPLAGGDHLSAVAFFKSETWLRPLHEGPLADYQDRRFVPPWER